MQPGALIDEPALAFLRQKIENHRDSLKNAEQNYKRLAEATEHTPVMPDLTALIETKDALAREKTAVNQAALTLSARISVNTQAMQGLSAEITNAAGLRQRYTQISHLSKTANGKLAGKQKLAFEQYAQASYFNKILRAANTRLSVMTHRRHELLRRTEASDLRAQTGLEIDVLDHYTGRVRPAKSLSGGESFMASLALALGLSDCVQQKLGGVEIDTLFIDEGFGALDAESLEQAIQILATLAAGNRLVGIISHVSELKERIDRRVVVHKSPQGSTISVSSH
jgi:exonuclease SbcC